LGHGVVRASIGCILCILSLAFVNEVQPFSSQKVNKLFVASQFQLLFTMIAALTLSSKSLGVFTLSENNMGWICFILSGIVPVFVVCLAYSMKLKEAGKVPLPKGMHW
jgi:phosphoglycerol transferase MdoB-like AlkP superfamily enzyme